jgi:hypothetical protein
MTILLDLPVVLVIEKYNWRRAVADTLNVMEALL